MRLFKKQDIEREVRDFTAELEDAARSFAVGFAQVLRLPSLVNRIVLDIVFD